MRIDDEIKSSFENHYHRAIVNLLYTNNYINSSMNDVLKHFKVTRQQYNVLRILRGQHPHPASVLLIKDRMLDKMSDASRIIERLQKKNMIVKSVCPSDRRSAEILISKEGLDLLKQMDPVVNDYDKIMKGLTPEEAQQLSLLLDKVRS